jgi:hypothetical protein
MLNVPEGTFKFPKFDHGPEENLKRYGVSEVPEWNVEDMRANVVLITGTEDRLANPTDVTELYRKLPEGRKKIHYIAGWDHITCLYPRDPKPLWNILEIELQ